MSALINLHPTDITNFKYVTKTFIVDADNRILAIRRSPHDKSRANYWDLPGGNVDMEDILAYYQNSGRGDRNDILHQVAIREIAEETGLHVEEIWSIHTASGYLPQEQTFRIILVYMARLMTSEPEITLSGEHTEYIWVSYTEFAGLEIGNDGGIYKTALQSLHRHGL